VFDSDIMSIPLGLYKGIFKVGGIWVPIEDQEHLTSVLTCMFSSHTNLTKYDLNESFI
jgi:hypothetical protein